MRVIVQVRYNLQWGQDFPQRYDPAWYAERLHLWTTYTLPSLLRQTFTSFECWLLCDPALYEFTVPLWQSLPDSRFRMVWDYREAYSQHGSEPVLLCRVDSDDMLHQWAVRDMAKWCRPGQYVQLMNGYCYSPTTGEVKRWVNPSPAFLGKMFTADEFRAATGLGHHGEVAETSRKINSPRFVVVCHGKNVCNTMRGRFVGELVEGEERARVRREYVI